MPGLYFVRAARIKSEAQDGAPEMIGSPAGVIDGVATRVATLPVFPRGPENTLLSELMSSL